MNDIQINNNQLTVTITGMDKLWGFKNRLIIPLDHVSDMTIENRKQLNQDGKWRVVQFRAPGLGLPWKQVGTFYGNHKRSYLNVSGNEHILFVSLTNEKYDYLFLTVNNPDELLSEFKRAKQKSIE
ncbi:hypothetical protein [Lentilactobacillus hilgardii]|uniref:hypothetical protein n=1 Tax=Lentilactobacillus hilgardii TaxID=1588 RepID=UPI00390C6188